MKYKVGDKVKIVNRETKGMNKYMTRYLGELMTIDSIDDYDLYPYKMAEDSGVWFWDNDMIEGLAEIEYGKTMTIDELKRRGLKNGDIYYEEFDNHYGCLHTGWKMVRRDKTISINTKSQNSHGTVEDALTHQGAGRQIKKILPVEVDVIGMYLSRFMHTFDEGLIKDYLVKILPSTPRQFVKAVHFGNDKRYTWLVPERLKDMEISIGDIVEVETVKGNQYVEVKDVFIENYNEDEDNYKEVISVIRSV